MLDDAVHLSVACGDYPWTADVMNGSVTVPGALVRPFLIPPAQLFRRQIRHADFDVSELGIAGFIRLVAAGDTRFVGLPVFTSRMFRRAYLFVSAESDLQDPRDLRGKRIGVQHYDMSVALYIRGFLQDDCGLSPQELVWFESGTRSSDGSDARTPLPAGITVTSVGGANLPQMLLAGDIDVLISAGPPPGYRRRDGQIRRLFRDPYGADLAAYERTKVFPIMHLMVLRRSLYEQYPWLARSLTNAFGEAKRNALDRMQDDGHSTSMLPLYRHYWEETQELFGDDFWPYGIHGNRRSLEAAARYSHTQGLADRLVSVEELFFEGAATTFGAY